jgi:hypothetical protein
MKKRKGGLDNDLGENDPMSGVANLFDLGLVFIVGLLISLFGAYHLQDLFSQKSVMTITKKNQDGQLEIITKKGNRIESVRVSQAKARGRGERLGIAYRLEDGTFVYVPE